MTRWTVLPPSECTPKAIVSSRCSNKGSFIVQGFKSPTTGAGRGLDGTSLRLPELSIAPRARLQQFPTCCLIFERRVDVGLTLHHPVKLASCQSHGYRLHCPAHVKSQVEDTNIQRLKTDLLVELEVESRGRSGDKRRDCLIFVLLYLIVYIVLSLWSQLRFG